MKTKSSGGDVRTAPRDLHPPAERAFVVQFERVDGARIRLRGRAEVVASGEATRFRSKKQLVDFMVGVLRRRAAGEKGGV